MKKLITAFTLVAFTMASTTTLASADDLAKGQKVFKRKLRKYCGFSGVRFARTHTQSEWEEIYYSGDFKEETKKICPRLNIKRIRESWWDYLYEFTYEYGQGGSHVPHC